MNESYIFSINLHSVIKIELRYRFWSGKGDNSHARWGGCAVFFTLLHQLAFRLQGNRVTGVQITAPACKIKWSTVILADEGCWTGVPLKMHQEVKVELNTGLKNGEIIFFGDERAFSTFLNNLARFFFSLYNGSQLGPKSHSNTKVC